LRPPSAFCLQVFDSTNLCLESFVSIEADQPADVDPEKTRWYEEYTARHAREGTAAAKKSRRTKDSEFINPQVSSSAAGGLACTPLAPPTLQPTRLWPPSGGAACLVPLV
jgi:hypothetical protein